MEFLGIQYAQSQYNMQINVESMEEVMNESIRRKAQLFNLFCECRLSVEVR